MGALADRVECVAQGGAMLVGPPRGGRLREVAGDDGAMEQVECGVVGRAPIAGGDADLVARFLDRVDLEEVVGEVRVGTGDPGLEPAR